MELYQKIVQARKKKGLTQEQLADLTNVTVRTIQRIESGESVPRSFTLKAIAASLDIPFEEMASTATKEEKAVQDSPALPATTDPGDKKHFLQMLCLSCYSFLVIPFVHFLIPAHLLKKSKEQNPKVIAFARKVIRVQIYWLIALHFIMLLTLAYNFIRTVYFEKTYFLNYLWPFFAMYIINAIIIAGFIVRLPRVDLASGSTKATG